MTTRVALMPLSLAGLGFGEGVGAGGEDGAEEGEDGVVGGFVRDAFAVDELFKFGV